MIRTTLIGILIFLFGYQCQSQKTDSICNCQRTVPIGTVAFGSMSFLALNEMWYKDYPRSSFHFFNDGNEWLQMDKVGHAFSTYQLNQFFFNQYQRTGYDMKRSLRNATISSLSYMTTIEILDGFSKHWGFSPIDFCANLSGSILHLIQQKNGTNKKFK